MRKIRKIHMWIGIIATVFLLIESVTGIIMYFDHGDRRVGTERAAFRMNGSMPAFANSSSNQQNGQSSSGGQADANAQNSQNNQSGQNGQNSSGAGRFGANGMNRFNGSGQFPGKESGGSFSMNVRSLHEGVVGLISGIGMLLLTGTGIVMSFIIWGANRRRGKRGKPDSGQQITMINPSNPS
ncbi:PepSY-associated TM helix domain-containing protein [Paenibacillus chibensis]|uniref:PepSY-associated TM helix domain-containing protein n=1 Tax=Paenibacillus chibensis TaxID=59846 RepID=A0ABU6PUL9_9BACL|nr:PepSY-associated TM helix domain-containing protein [Paenibacillus chibensis]